MDEISSDRKQKAQNKYRKSQSNKALTRFELQVKTESKARFEAMVKAAAGEYHSPWDERQRIAKARAQIFDEITQGLSHEFTALNTQIDLLRNEIKALSPSFFIDPDGLMALPHAVASLPDDPKQLKAILAKTYSEAQGAKQRAEKHKSDSDRYRKLYETVSDYNDELQKRLKTDLETE